MSAVDQFTEWYRRLQDCVQQALAGPLADGLKQAIWEKAETNVYKAYEATGKRRGQIGSRQNLQATGNDYTLKIRNITQPQGSGASMTETTFVESGATNYRQPFPRPFMDEARDEYAAGKAQDDLAAFLGSHGFIVT